MLRFIVFGAVGFAAGPALAGALLGLVVGLPFAGAVGGAALGLALRDWRRTASLALLGALGMTVGLIAGLVVASFSYASEGPVAATVGAVVGASLGSTFAHWRTNAALAVAGAAGFYVGSVPADFVRFYVPVLRQLGEAGSYVVVGLVGGASLGAALGYLEYRKLPAELRPRVR